MGLADFFGRNAVAASQIVSGFDDAAFTDLLSNSSIGIAFGTDAACNAEGQHLLDMTVRLLARLYPTIVFTAGPDAEALADDLAALAVAINPNIDIDFNGCGTKTIAVGTKLPHIANATQTVYAGCNGWDAIVSETDACGVGQSSNPFGAGAAAALACAKVFNLICGDESQRVLFTPDVTLSTLEGEAAPTQDPLSPDDVTLADRTALVGLGAIGNAVIWALSRAAVTGVVHLIDDEDIELSNLQRYVLALRTDEGRSKSEHLASHLGGRLRPLAYPMDWASFVALHGYEWDQAIVALDSARDRRAVQSSLPRAIVNGWTQAGDLGVSQHGEFGRPGACLSCLYLPSGVAPSEDVLVAEALRVPERTMDIRKLLHLREPAPDELLALIAQRLGIADDAIARFRGVPVRKLYVEGVCGGALISPTVSSAPRELHVPIAHQSALAGILLAAAAIRQVIRPRRDTTSVTRLDVMKPVGAFLTQMSRADERGLCICRDPEYVAVFRNKYRGGVSSSDDQAVLA